MNITSLKLLFSPVYLFNPYPGYSFSFAQFFLILFVFMVLLAVVLSLISAKRKKRPEVALYSFIATWSGWIAVVGLMLLFFRTQGIPYFSIRAFMLAWILFAIVWMIYSLPKVIKKVKSKKKEIADMERKLRYFKK